MSANVASTKISSQAVKGGTLAKLALFTLALGLGPISSYFASLWYLWEGNATYAAITAVVAANIVLVGYIIISVREDQASQVPPEETKKDK